MDPPQQEDAYLTCSNQASLLRLHASGAHVSNTGSLCNVKIFANILRQKQKVLKFTHTQIKQGI